MTTRRTKQQVLAEAKCAVFDHWLNTGDGSTVAEIAEAIDVPANTLRRHVDGGVPPCCCVRDITRASYSKNYVGTIIAHRTVFGWVPTEGYMRARFRKLSEARVEENKAQQ